MTGRGPRNAAAMRTMKKTTDRRSGVPAMTTRTMRREAKHGPATRTRTKRTMIGRGRRVATGKRTIGRAGKKSKLGLARIGLLLLLISLGLYAGSMALHILFLLIALIGGVIPGGLSIVTGNPRPGELARRPGRLGAVHRRSFKDAGPRYCRGRRCRRAFGAGVCHGHRFGLIRGLELPLQPLLSKINRLKDFMEKSRELEKEIQKNPGSARAKELQEEMKSMTQDDLTVR